MKSFVKFVKVVSVIVAIVGAAYGGFLVGNDHDLAKYFLPRDWEFERGIGQTEVRADYDFTNATVNGEEMVYTEVLLWDEGFENYEVVKSGFYPKVSLTDLSEQAADETSWVARW